MKIKTIVVAPYAGLVELTSSLKSELIDFDITIVQADLSEIKPLLQQIHSEAYDVIISRGGTAKMLREHTDLPIIDIQVSGFDMLRILMLLKGYQSKIKMIGFQNIIEGFESISDLVDVDLAYAVLQDENEVDDALSTAQQEDIKVVVGDTVAVRKAAHYGMQGVLITSGRESVLESFSQAKQLFKITQVHRHKIKAFENLLDLSELGYAIVDQQGHLLFANTKFRSQFQLATSVYRLSLIHRDLIKLIEDLEQGVSLRFHMIIESNSELAVTGRELLKTEDQTIYVLRTQPASAITHGIKINYGMHGLNIFPQFVMTGVQFQEEGTIRNSSPIAIYGEKGVGKRLFCLKHWSSSPGEQRTMTELDILDYDDDTFNALKHVISSGQDHQIIYICGIERLALKDQRELIPSLNQSSSQLVLSFDRHPIKLAAENRLDNKLYKLVEPQIIHIPPLRDRMDAFEEYVRTFLIAFNEQYGKQIVGLRPKVMEWLYARDWKENLFELKQVIEQFVKTSDGEYVEEDVIGLLDGMNQASERTSLSQGIDLSKPLEEIEKDIILKVLEQEDMNQSAAAKRLGINRSTLWRKIKQN